MKNKTIVIGLGNTILSDDAVGIITAKKVYENLKLSLPQHDLTLTESSLSGWRLLDLVTGYTNVIIIDSVCTPQGLPGDLYIITDTSKNNPNPQTSHGTGLFQVLSLAKECGIDSPKEISIYAIEVKNPFEFGESISTEIYDKIPAIVDKIVADVTKVGGICNA